MKRQHIIISKRQAKAIADTLASAPESALYYVEQTVDDIGGTHLYLHDRTLADPCVHIARYSGSVSPRMDSDRQE
jgi:hypothetical protein